MGGSPGIQSVFTQRIVVGVGDMAVSNNSNATISTYALGSCIGIVAYDPFNAIGGMLHIMLPDSKLSPEKSKTQPSMFADTGLRNFMNALHGMKVQPANLRLVLAGGASVIGKSDMFNIGERNAIAVTKLLSSAKFKILGKELGGINNRTLHLEVNTGILEIKTSSLGVKKISLK